MLISDVLQNAIVVTDAVRRFYIQCLLYHIESDFSHLFQRLAEQEIHQLRSLKQAREELLAHGLHSSIVDDEVITQLVDTAEKISFLVDMVKPDTSIIQLADYAITIEYSFYYRRLSNSVMYIITKIMGSKESVAFTQYLAMEDEHRKTLAELFDIKRSAKVQVG